MKTFTGWEYLLIDAANAFGKDKLTFEKRIEWATAHLQELESLAEQADSKPLFIKAVMAIRKAQKGIPTGHLVGFDAVCSGIQIMSALTGCVSGATATGLVNPDVRADAYTELTKEMQKLLGPGFNVSRADAKDALMKSFYGSRTEPIAIFGVGTPELNAFYKAAYVVAPGAWGLLQELLASWKPMALSHEWKLPDGFDAKVRVMQTVETRIEVDELDHATFTYQYKENLGSAKGLSNVANVVHSIDAYLLRCIHRRCNYDEIAVMFASDLIGVEINKRALGMGGKWANVDNKLPYYLEQYDRSGIADVVILPYLTSNGIGLLSTEHLLALQEIVKGMLSYKPFEVVTIHDEFKAHGNNLNYLRQQYINVMAQLADSELLSDILGQLHGKSGKYEKLSENLSELIKKSSYAIC